jgi:membrane protease YdiL (CAAX protease family)
LQALNVLHALLRQRVLFGAEFNLITSLLFVLGHLWQHPAAWAVAIAVPSLVFGWFRDRHDSVYPCIALHMFYNTGYFALTGLP